MTAPFARLRRSHGVARKRQGLLQLCGKGCVERDIHESAQTRNARRGIGDEFGGIDGRPPRARQCGKILHHAGMRAAPLEGRDLLQRPAGVALPARRQQQGPRAVSRGKPPVGDKTPRAPGIDDAAQIRQGVTHQVDEQRIGKQRIQKGNTQRVFWRFFQQSHASRVRRIERTSGPITDLREELRGDRLRELGIEQRRREAVRVHHAAHRAQLGIGLEQAVALVAQRPQRLGLHQRLEQQRAAGARRRHDENGPLQHRAHGEGPSSYQLMSSVAISPIGLPVRAEAQSRFAAVKVISQKGKGSRRSQVTSLASRSTR